MKAVLWDLDGVLFDTAPAHFHVWNETLAEYGIKLSYAQFLPTFGMKNQDFLPVLFGRPLSPEFIDEVAHKKELRFREAARQGGAPVQPGVIAWLDRFQTLGLKQAVASSAPPENVAAMLDAGKLHPFFQAVVSSSGLPGKPHPAIFQQAADRLSLPYPDCLVIEDAPVGIQAAHLAGMRCVAVATSYPFAELGDADQVVMRFGAAELDEVLRL